MHSIIKNSFGGLSARYYFRQLVFGAGLTLVIVAMMARHPEPMAVGLVVVLLVNALLYPYARFAYESAVEFVVGDNVFIVPAFIALFFKILTMALCFSFAVFIAPVALIYLYIHHKATSP